MTEPTVPSQVNPITSAIAEKSVKVSFVESINQMHNWILGEAKEVMQGEAKAIQNLFQTELENLKKAWEAIKAEITKETLNTQQVIANQSQSVQTQMQSHQQSLTTQAQTLQTQIETQLNKLTNFEAQIIKKIDDVRLALIKETEARFKNQDDNKNKLFEKTLAELEKRITAQESELTKEREKIKMVSRIFIDTNKGIGDAIKNLGKVGDVLGLDEKK